MDASFCMSVSNRGRRISSSRRTGEQKDRSRFIGKNPCWPKNQCWPKMKKRLDWLFCWSRCPSVAYVRQSARLHAVAVRIRPTPGHFRPTIGHFRPTPGRFRPYLCFDYDSGPQAREDLSLPNFWTYPFSSDIG